MTGLGGRGSYPEGTGERIILFEEKEAVSERDIHINEEVFQM